jgi:ATP-binding cassette subfamily C protein LapB
MQPQPETVPTYTWHIPADGSTHDDSLLGCLLIACKLLQSPQSADSLTAGLPLVDNKLTPELLIRAAQRAGITARVVRRPLQEISNLVLPAILLLENGRACVLEQVDDDGNARLILPESHHGLSEQPLEELAKEYSGYVIFLQPAYRFDERTHHTALLRPKHWFWDTFSASWPIYGEVLLASLLINLFALASPLFIMNVYDRVVPNQAIETLWVLSIGIVTVFGFDLLMKTLRGYFVDVAGKRADIILSATLFERVLGIRFASRPASVGAFANNLHEFDAFRDFFTSASLTALIDLPFLFLFILIIWLIGGPLAWIPLAVLPLSLLAGYIVQRALSGKVRDLLRHAGQKQATLIETLTGLETVKSLGAESPLQHRWEQITGNIANLGLKTRFLSSSAVNITVFLQQLSTVAVVVYGVYLIADGELSLGGLIACTILTGRALAPLAQVAATLSRYHQARAAYASTSSLMALPLEQSPDRNYLDRPVIEGAVEFRNVSFCYPRQGVAALSDVSFRLKAGEKVAIIGRIGSGKSTIQKLILGLYEPDEGAVLVDSVDCRQINPADLRRNIGNVPQDTLLFYGTVKENIKLGMPHADDHAVLAAAEIAGVTDFVNRHPSGFDMQVGERGEGLSGGQRQSVAVARALLREPPVIVMDEPSNAMDNTTEELFKTRLGKWLGNKTLVLVTHRASLLSLVDRVIVLDAGRIVADGPKEQVLDALRQGQIRVSKP